MLHTDISYRLSFDRYALSSIIEFDSPVYVHRNGAVTTDETSPRIMAPEAVGDYWTDQKWQPLRGRSGQELGRLARKNYVMHPSEYIGGRLARDVLATPGWWVAVVVESEDGGEEPDGWALFHRDDAPPPGLRYRRIKVEDIGFTTDPMCPQCRMTVDTHPLDADLGAWLVRCDCGLSEYPTGSAVRVTVPEGCNVGEADD